MRWSTRTSRRYPSLLLILDMRRGEGYTVGSDFANACLQLSRSAALTAHTTKVSQPNSTSIELSPRAVTSTATSTSAGHANTMLRWYDASSQERTNAKLTSPMKITSPTRPS